MEFDWDEDNEDHIAENGVTPEEVEELFFNNPISYPAHKGSGERRKGAIGQTNAGRYLVVIYTIRYEMIRTVTAYQAGDKHRRQYQQRRG